VIAVDRPLALLSRIEDAGINASAPQQQRWIDGWLVRFSPAKAQRALHQRAERRTDDGRTAPGRMPDLV
jgi:hypothetical protein